MHATYISDYIYSTYISDYTHTHTHTYTYYFRADHLVLDNQLKGSSLEKTISPFLIIHWLPIVLCLVLGIGMISPFCERNVLNLKLLLENYVF